MKLNKELKELFTDNRRNNETMYGYMEYADALTEKEIGFGLVEDHGGEDMGSEFYTVWKFTRDNEECYFKFEGWYASFVGAEFQCVFEVTPKEVTRVEYV